MKDKLILKNGSIVELEAGAALSNLTAVYPDKAAMVADWDKLTSDNLVSVSVQNGDGLTVGNYTNLILMEPNLTATELADGTIKVIFGMREKTDIEKRLDNIEEGQEVQDGAIVELAGIVAGGEA